MGRISKNKTYEEVLAAGRIRAKKYYDLHRTELRKRAMDRYNKLKNDSLNKNNS